MICKDEKCHRNIQEKPGITPKGHKVLIAECDCGSKSVRMAVKHD